MNGLEKLVVVANRLDSLGLAKEADSLDNIIVKFAEVYGSQAVIYHGSHSEPDVFIPWILENKFEPGHGSGGLYGSGLYCVYNLDGTKTNMGRYGSYIYKLKVNLHGFICFNSNIAKLVYGDDLHPFEQGERLGLSKQIIDMLKSIDSVGSTWESVRANSISDYLKGKVKGLIFNGHNDGPVAVVYDPAVVVPISWKIAGETKWMGVDKDSLGPSVRRSALDEWEPERYESAKIPNNARRVSVAQRTKSLLLKLRKLPIERRVFIGDINTSDSNGDFARLLCEGLKVEGNLYILGSEIESLPANMKIGGEMVINRCKNLKSLPPGLVIDGELTVSKSGVSSLPDDLQVGYMSIERTEISSLPDGLQVRGKIYGFEGDLSNVPKHLIDKLESI